MLKWILGAVAVLAVIAIGALIGLMRLFSHFDDEA